MARLHARFGAPRGEAGPTPVSPHHQGPNITTIKAVVPMNRARALAILPLDS